MIDINNVMKLVANQTKGFNSREYQIGDEEILQAGFWWEDATPESGHSWSQSVQLGRDNIVNEQVGMDFPVEIFKIPKLCGHKVPSHVHLFDQASCRTGTAIMRRNLLGRKSFVALTTVLM